MKISVDQLRTMVREAVRARLQENMISEGPREIGIRTVMMDLKEPIVGSLAVDIANETGIEEQRAEQAVSNAYEKMIVDVVRALDVPLATATGPRRRIVAPGG